MKMFAAGWMQLGQAARRGRVVGMFKIAAWGGLCFGALPGLGSTWGGFMTQAQAQAAKPSVVRLQANQHAARLLVNGEPFEIRGVGGDADKAMLPVIGGNAFRTWGVGPDTKKQLDEAHRLGLKVAVGIWLGHPRHGFDYSNAEQVAQQKEQVKQAILAYKDHPAVLLWGLGNEMEQYDATTDPVMWAAVNDLALMAKQLDPNHPTMTVIAEIGGDRLPSIGKLCPAIDIVGINSYGGVASIPQRYQQANIGKPYIVTEYGPAGTWEVGTNAWDVPIELTSTAKAQVYADAYNALLNDRHCLGSFAFTWGQKQEATATWFGMFMADGTKLGAVDALAERWTGQPPANQCPKVKPLTIQGQAGDQHPGDQPDAGQVDPGAKVRVALVANDPDGDAMAVEWILQEEASTFTTMGDFQAAPAKHPLAIQNPSLEGVDLQMPNKPGNYRLFAFVKDGQGGGATANLPLKVKGQVGVQAAPAATLPLHVYSDQANKNSPYVPSGYMGNAEAVSMDAANPTDPHSGQTCLKVDYKQTDGWAGVVWQSPANDWGDVPGGLDLSKAGQLSFWARGEKGGEVVTFGFGLLGADKAYPDSGKAEKKATLTQQWQRFDIPLSGRDMRCIKTGFYWTLASGGQPVTFYLDDIVYTDANGLGGDGAAAAKPKQAQLPLLVLGDGVQASKAPWTPSGYMGDASAIAMVPNHTERPHTGETCTLARFNQAGGWGGVVWQNPANDWGDLPGGLDLSGAKRLTFWARGEEGGEVVTFGFGLLGADVAYTDSAKAETKIKLTQDWQQHTIDLTGKNLSQIKTGFYWVVAGQGKPIAFCIDDVRYE